MEKGQVRISMSDLNTADRLEGLDKSAAEAWNGRDVLDYSKLFLN